MMQSGASALFRSRSLKSRYGLDGSLDKRFGGLYLLRHEADRMVEGYCPWIAGSEDGRIWFICRGSAPRSKAGAADASDPVAARRGLVQTTVEATRSRVWVNITAPRKTAVFVKAG